MPERQIIDLFAGAGGWDEGLADLGFLALGIEIDPMACQTARAAGHERMEADVVALDPRELGPVWGLIGSPPCQAYSSAGKQRGRVDKPRVVACAHELAAGHDTRALHRKQCADRRSLLTVEPLRFAFALRPRWIALEQVPPVLELWSLFAGLLGVHGYRTAVGILSAEQYGVAQTRKRAFLLASLDGPVPLPAPTHRSYDPRRPEQVRPEEAELPSWVSMAQALGWDTPAPAVVATGRSRVRRGGCVVERGGHASGGSVVGAGRMALDRRQGGVPLRSSERPAPTLTSNGLARGAAVWVTQRPATTVAGDSRIQPPGHKHNRFDPPGRFPGRAGNQAVRVTVAQAAMLQGFRPGYPWRGTKTQQLTQVGNAVCPPVARAVLDQAMHPSRRADEGPTGGGA